MFRFDLQQAEGYAIIIGSSSFPLWVKSKTSRVDRGSCQKAEDNQESYRAALALLSALPWMIPGAKWAGPAVMREAPSSALPETVGLVAGLPIPQ